MLILSNQPSFMPAFTTIAEVDRIAAHPDPVKRNYRITQSYHELSRVMAQRLGLCANWCTFATWASRQAGRTIRREDLAQALERYLAEVPELKEAVAAIVQGALDRGARMDKRGIVQLVWDCVDPNAAMVRAADAVARGNQKVYAEIGREFARFIEACLNDEGSRPDQIAAYCAALRPGDPPDGQRYLQHAFSCYYQAMFEPDPRAKAELIFLANLEIGFHEQTRLQPEIREALEASVIDARQFRKNLVRALFPNQGWLEQLWELIIALLNRPTPLNRAIEAFTARARHHVRLFLTKNLMELGFPEGLRLPLGKDLQAHFPAHLSSLTNPELLALLKTIDPTPDSLRDSGAADWADLSERLHFIGDLFRCYQETKVLVSEPPFDVAVKVEFD
jgi:hypothetical protein